MWVERTPEEIKKWQIAAEQEARSHARLIAIGLLIVVSVLFAGGWLVSFRGGFAVHHDMPGSFWLRLLICAVIMAPLSWFVFRRECRNESAKIHDRSICTKCDTAANGAAGALCSCGGAFVPLSAVKCS